MAEPFGFQDSGRKGLLALVFSPSSLFRLFLMYGISDCLALQDYVCHRCWYTSIVPAVVSRWWLYNHFPLYLHHPIYHWNRLHNSIKIQIKALACFSFQKRTCVLNILYTQSYLKHMECQVNFVLSFYSPLKVLLIKAKADLNYGQIQIINGPVLDWIIWLHLRKPVCHRLSENYKNLYCTLSDWMAHNTLSVKNIWN